MSLVPSEQFRHSCIYRFYWLACGQSGNRGFTMTVCKKTLEWVKCVKMRLWGLSFLREFLFNARCASNHLDLAIFNPICSATVTSFHSFDSLAVHWDGRLLRFFRTSRDRRVWGYMLTKQFGELFCLPSACVFENVVFFLWNISSNWLSCVLNMLVNNFEFLCYCCFMVISVNSSCTFKINSGNCSIKS